MFFRSYFAVLLKITIVVSVLVIIFVWILYANFSNGSKKKSHNSEEKKTEKIAATKSNVNDSEQIATDQKLKTNEVRSETTSKEKKTERITATTKSDANNSEQFAFDQTFKTNELQPETTFKEKKTERITTTTQSDANNSEQITTDQKYKTNEIQPETTFKEKKTENITATKSNVNNSEQFSYDQKLKTNEIQPETTRNLNIINTNVSKQNTKFLLQIQNMRNPTGENLCYMIVVLQILNFIPEFRSCIMKCANAIKNEKYPILKYLIQFFEGYISTNNQKYDWDYKNFIEVLKLKESTFVYSNKKQHNAVDFFADFIKLLHNEIQEYEQTEDINIVFGGIFDTESYLCQEKCNVEVPKKTRIGANAYKIKHLISIPSEVSIIQGVIEHTNKFLKRRKCVCFRRQFIPESNNSDLNKRIKLKMIYFPQILAISLIREVDFSREPHCFQKTKISMNLEIQDQKYLLSHFIYHSFNFITKENTSEVLVKGHYIAYININNVWFVLDDQYGIPSYVIKDKDGRNSTRELEKDTNYSILFAENSFNSTENQNFIDSVEGNISMLFYRKAKTNRDN